MKNVFIVVVLVFFGCNQKKIIQRCNFEKQDINILLLEDTSKNRYISLQERGKITETKLDLNSFNELASVDFNCNYYRNLFQIIFSEKMGNSYQYIIHNFSLNKKGTFSLSTIYTKTSDRNGISLYYSSLVPLDLSNYNAFVKTDLKYNEIYSFTGFQEDNTPCIDDYFNKIKLNKLDSDVLKIMSTQVVLDFMIENIAISNENLLKYNDIAYYLEQSSLFEEAIYLLNKIIKSFPNRTVAYINLSDAYWGLGNFSKAKQAYKTYIKQMKTNKKEAKIPKQVLERVK